MNEIFEMVAKTFQGLEEVLAEELRGIGAENVRPGRRMVAFEGDLSIMYKANLCCRTALRILKPFHAFEAHNPDELYDKVKEYDWSEVLTLDKTFSIDVTAYSEEFTHSRYVTYRVKDAIADYFQDRFGRDKRPKVRLQDADAMINVHISGSEVTLSLDSSGESLHKRGYRVEQTEAPINEVLAAGIILKSGWRGDSPLVDPMCGSGTFLIEAALIAANINPGIYRNGFAFEHWKDFDAELFESIYNDDSAERDVEYKIYGSDISPRAISIAQRNIRSAGVGRYIELEARPIAKWDEAPQPAGVLVTNPPYGERISAPDMEGLYETIGERLKHVFTGYHAWIIGYRDEYFKCIGLTPSQRIPMLNGSLECELREYVIFDGDKKSFLSNGGKLKDAPMEQRKGSRRDDRRGDKFRGERRDDRRDDRRGSGFRGERRDDRRGDRRDGGFRGERRDDRRDDRRSGGFRSERRDDRRGDGFRDDRGGGFDSRRRTPRREGGFGGRDDRRDKPSFRNSERPERRRDNDDRRDFKPMRESNSDNPLQQRRNLGLLKAIKGQGPTLPPQEGPFMRIRRGWRPPKDEQGGEEA